MSFRAKSRASPLSLRHIYTMALTEAVGLLQGQTDRAFADIKTVADAQNLQVRDPARFAILQQRLATAAAIHQEAQRVAEQRRAQSAQEYQRQHETWAKDQDKALGQFVPELADGADPEVQRPLQQAALEALKNAGFTDDELHAAWAKGRPFLLRDTRAQRIIADAAKWRMAQARTKELSAHKKQAPPVQRPGISRASEIDHSQIEHLEETLQRSGRVDDAVALLQARRKRK
jgi:hypothetical protein